jgi:hypothetical protein
MSDLAIVVGGDFDINITVPTWVDHSRVSSASYNVGEMCESLTLDLIDEHRFFVEARNVPGVGGPARKSCEW